MSLIPPWEKIVETKKCRISGQEFVVTDKDLEFYDKVSPIFGGQKYSIPSPSLCAEERMKNIQCFINQRNLHKIKSWLSGKEIISNFWPHCPFPVYSVEEWYGDGWSAQNYGKDITFQKTFFAQFQTPLSRVPHWALSQWSNNENSEYTNHGQGNKSCYLLLTGSLNTQVYYATYVYSSLDCMDCEFIKECELCFECVDIQKCYKLFCSVDCSSCSDSFFLKSCTNCQNCFGSCNLIWKKFHIFNEDVGETKYREFIDSYLSLSAEARKKIKKDVALLWTKSIQSSIHGYSNQSVVWDYIYNSSNVWNSFEIKNAQDIKNCVSLDGASSIYDCIMSRNSEWNYYSSLVSHYASYVAFWSSVMGEGSRMYYSDSCVGASDCFACSWFHSHEHHCILNKPYSVQEYESLCGKIIDHMRSTGEWWEFFPYELSPFGYNETVAQEYFPLTESEVKSHGWNWYDEPEKTFEGTSITPLPISQYDEKKVGYDTAQKNIDTLLAGIVQCEVTGKPFKIIRQELAFYIENSLPIPTKHPDQRHKERMDLRNPRTLYERTCSECMQAITTTYSPDRPERVVCEECYRKLVY